MIKIKNINDKSGANNIKFLVVIFIELNLFNDISKPLKAIKIIKNSLIDIAIKYKINLIFKSSSNNNGEYKNNEGKGDDIKSPNKIIFKGKKLFPI